MTNEEANSPLGIASRGLAFALVEQVAGKDWRDRDVTALQTALFDYGKALKTSYVETMPMEPVRGG